MSCCRRKRKQERKEEEVPIESDPRVARELHKLAASTGRTKRLRFGDDGVPAWVKIVQAGTRRPEVTLLVDGTPRKFRARCFPTGAGTLEECETLEREAAMPAGTFDLVLPGKLVNSMLKIQLLGMDEHMNLCFRLLKSWDS